MTRPRAKRFVFVVLVLGLGLGSANRAQAEHLTSYDFTGHLLSTPSVTFSGQIRFSTDMVQTSALGGSAYYTPDTSHTLTLTATVHDSAGDTTYGGISAGRRVPRVSGLQHYQ